MIGITTTNCHVQYYWCCVWTSIDGKVEAISRACTPRRPMLLLEVQSRDFELHILSMSLIFNPVSLCFTCKAQQLIQVWMSNREQWRLLGEQWLPYAQALIFCWDGRKETNQNESDQSIWYANPWNWMMFALETVSTGLNLFELELLRVLVSV